MAYKFQIGAAKMSGSLEQEGNVDIADSGSLKIEGTTVIDASRNFSPALLKMPDVASGKILVADGTSYEEVAVSGDVSIASNGEVTIANDAVEQAMIADDAVGADQLASNAVVNASIASGAAIDMDKLDGGSLDASLSDLAQGDLMYAGDVDDGNNLKSITFSNLEDAIFGNVGSDATIAAGGALTIATNAVITAKILDANVTLAKVQDVAANSLLIRNANSSGVLSELALATTEIMIGDGTGMVAAALSGDVTMSNTGAVSIGATKVTGAMLNDDVISAQDELAADGLVAADELMISDGGVLKRIGVDNLFLDGPGLLTAATISVADDHFMFLDGSASGSAKTESIVDLVSAMAGAGITATNGVLSTDGGSVTDWGLGATATLAEGFNYRAVAALSGNVALTLPGSTAPTVGDVVHVKAPASLGGFDLEINTYANQTVDGVQAIELESGGAAVSMVYIASGSWAIF